jgi:hypothetical protein
MYQTPRALQLRQRQELLDCEMSWFFIGQSVMMFGVLVSMMYLQIRLMGSLLVLLLTIIFHPSFWTQVVLGYQ